MNVADVNNLLIKGKMMYRIFLCLFPPFGSTNLPPFHDDFRRLDYFVKISIYDEHGHRFSHAKSVRAKLVVNICSN
jgi:hypothetical protein